MISEDSFETIVPRCLVPQHRHRHPRRRLRVGRLVDLAQEALAQQPVARRAGKVGVEGPAVRLHQRMHDADVDVVFQPLQAAEDQRPVRPGAGRGDIEVIAPGFGGEPAFARGAGAAVRRHPVAERGCLALELSAGALRIVPGVVPLAVDQQAHSRLRALPAMRGNDGAAVLKAADRAKDRCAWRNLVRGGGAAARRRGGVSRRQPARTPAPRGRRPVRRSALPRSRPAAHPAARSARR